MFEPDMKATTSMAIRRPRVCRPLVAAGLFIALALALAACDLGSSDSTTAVISDSGGTIYNFSGQYISSTTNTTNNSTLLPLVIPSGRQSGRQLTWLRLLQYGSVLEGFDNAGMNWKGQISSVNTKGSAQFTLNGRTTAGANVEIVGALHQNSSNSPANSLMDAAWIEPGFAGSIFARASVPEATTPDPKPSDDKDDSDDDKDNGKLIVGHIHILPDAP